MTLFENKSVQRIWARFKKLFFVLLLLPIVLAALGYVIGMNQTTSTNAKAAIMLGDFDSKAELGKEKKYVKKYNLTDTGTAQQMLKSENFLSNLKDEYGLSYDPKELASKTNPTIMPGKIIELSYSSDNANKSEKVLKELVRAFVDFSNTAYNKDYTLFERSLSLAQKSSTIEDSEKQDAINNAYKDFNHLAPAYIIKDVEVDKQQANPIRKAILGFLIGVMFSISILLAPEALRK